MPEIAALMLAYRRAVERVVPGSLVFEGRTYYVRAGVLVKMDVFDSPSAAEPLLRGAICTAEGVGHAPGH